MDAPTQSSPCEARSIDEDDDGLGDDDDLLELVAADEESKLQEVSDRGFSP